jgi:hypothetical protein
MRKDALNGDKSLYFPDFHSNSAVTPTGLSIEGRQFFRREQHGIRVVQLAHQTTGRFLVERGGVDAIDKAAGYDLKHLVEESRSVTGFLPLDDETASQKRKQYESKQCDFSGI